MSVGPGSNRALKPTLTGLPSLTGPPLPRVAVGLTLLDGHVGRVLGEAAVLVDDPGLDGVGRRTVGECAAVEATVLAVA